MTNHKVSFVLLAFAFGLTACGGINRVGFSADQNSADLNTGAVAPITQPPADDDGENVWTPITNPTSPINEIPAVCPNSDKCEELGKICERNDQLYQCLHQSPRPPMCKDNMCLICENGSCQPVDKDLIIPRPEPIAVNPQDPLPSPVTGQPLPGGTSPEPINYDPNKKQWSGGGGGRWDRQYIKVY